MIAMKLVELVGIQLDADSGAHMLLLREQDEPHRLLPIVIGGLEATSIAIAATGQRAPRPLTHDLMAALVESLDGHLDAVEVTDLLDGAFIAQLDVSGPNGEQQLDTRPSDAIALAVRLHAPLYVSEHVLDEAGTIPEQIVDEATTAAPIASDIDADIDADIAADIDAEVEDFRTFLEQLDPDDFLDAPPPTDTGTPDVTGVPDVTGAPDGTADTGTTPPETDTDAPTDDRAPTTDAETERDEPPGVHGTS